jgi:2-hydroxy-6-oxonona-2,4-dienedioate hydrolase
VHALVSERAPAGGTPLLVIHGLGMSSRYLVPTLEVLAETHRVYAPDLPGCGHSERPAQPQHLHELADAVVSWMAALGITAPVLVGHSVGAQVAAHVAARHPDRISGLLMASPTGDPATRRWHQAAALLGDARRESPGLIPIAARDYLRAGPVRMWRTFRLSRQDDTLELLQGVRHRCLVVRGGDDEVVTGDWARAVADASQAERLVTIPEAPHGLPFSAAPSFAATIRAFASSSPTSA